MRVGGTLYHSFSRCRDCEAWPKSLAAQILETGGGRARRLAQGSVIIVAHPRYVLECYPSLPCSVSVGLIYSLVSTL